MKHLTSLISGVIILLIFSIMEINLLPVLLISAIVFILIGLHNCYWNNDKVYTNKEITMLGELEKVDGSCNNTITYLYTYKRKQYLITYVGDLELMNPNESALTI